MPISQALFDASEARPGSIIVGLQEATDASAI